MRTLRLSLVAMVTVVLLGGLSGAVIGQTEEPSADLPWPRLEQRFEYGTDDTFRQVIHAWRPEPRDAPRPAVVFFHGGGLVMGSPMQDADWARWVAEQGYVAFMAGYRLFEPLSAENPWPAQLDDAQRAIRWVRAHADEFNVDPGRICAIGHSSGGHLAGLVGTTEATDDTDPELAGVSSRVDCVVSVSGDADLTVPYENTYWTEVFDQMFGGTVEEVPEVWQAASPALDVDEDTVPFLIIHGDHDEEVPVEMARNLADALAAAGIEYVFAEVDAGHLDVGIRGQRQAHGDIPRLSTAPGGVTALRRLDALRSDWVTQSGDRLNTHLPQTAPQQDTRSAPTACTARSSPVTTPETLRAGSGWCVLSTQGTRSWVDRRGSDLPADAILRDHGGRG